MPRAAFDADILVLYAMHFPSDGPREKRVSIVATFEAGNPWLDVERVLTRDFQVFSKVLDARDGEGRVNRFMVFWQTQTHNRHPHPLRLNESAKELDAGHTFRGDIVVVRMGERRHYTSLTKATHKDCARAVVRRFLAAATRLAEVRRTGGEDTRTIVPADLDAYL